MDLFWYNRNFMTLSLIWQKLMSCSDLAGGLDLVAKEAPRRIGLSGGLPVYGGGSFKPCTDCRTSLLLQPKVSKFVSFLLLLCDCGVKYEFPLDVGALRLGLLFSISRHQSASIMNLHHQHQPGSMSINQHQLISISINQWQFANFIVNQEENLCILAWILKIIYWHKCSKSDKIWNLNKDTWFI